MAKKIDNFVRTMMLITFLGYGGAFIGGEIGALIGCLAGLGLGILSWHKHDWKRVPLYDDRGKLMMIKICETCKETEFDGWFEREEN